jgi:hypothetical protein
VIERLTNSNQWKFFGVLPKADRPLALAWWFVLLLRGVLTAQFAIAMGFLVGAVQSGGSLTVPLSAAGVVFVAASGRYRTMFVQASRFGGESGEGGEEGVELSAHAIDAGGTAERAAGAVDEAAGRWSGPTQSKCRNRSRCRTRGLGCRHLVPQYGGKT